MLVVFEDKRKSKILKIDINYAGTHVSLSKLFLRKSTKKVSIIFSRSVALMQPNIWLVRNSFTFDKGQSRGFAILEIIALVILPASTCTQQCFACPP
jgi:hypothetical protein